MADETMTRVPDAVPVIRMYCPACGSENTVVSYRSGDGHLYCRCLGCACRFWGA
jgi:hypothetical protein